jgi:hypothetical protein
MSIDLARILTALKHTLHTAREFMAPWRQFHDDVAVACLAAPIGVPAENPTLERCIAAVAGRLYHQPQVDTVEDPCFSYVAEHGFWHGSCFVADRVAICFWFAGEEIGLVGFMSAPDGGDVHLARLRRFDRPEGTWSGVAGSERRN